MPRDFEALGKGGEALGFNTFAFFFVFDVGETNLSENEAGLAGKLCSNCLDSKSHTVSCLVDLMKLRRAIQRRKKKETAKTFLTHLLFDLSELPCV